MTASSVEKYFTSERRQLRISKRQCSHGRGDLFTSEDNMLFDSSPGISLVVI